MPLFTNSQHTLFFIHVPKVGGSFYERSLIVEGWHRYFSVNGIPPDKLGHLKCSPQHYHAKLYEQIIDVEKVTETVLICRDPVDRIKSEYYWQCKCGLTDLEPSEWLDFVFSEYRKNSYIFDNHIRPQVEFIPTSGPYRCFRLEDGGLEAALILARRYNPQTIVAKLRMFMSSDKNDKRSRYLDTIESAFLSRAPDIRNFYSDDYLFLKGMN